ncbi:MAG: hypothetical protein ABL998_15545 [Planctomycetota bacterium]
MGLPRSLVLLAALAAGASSCQLAQAHAFNLAELHDAEGRPARRGTLRSPIGYLFNETLRSSNFRGGAALDEAEPKEERIEDPLGSCLENVLDLAACTRDGGAADEKVLGLQVENFAWLVKDCTYVLTRERCASELGRLVVWLDPAKAPTPEGTSASAEVVAATFEQLATCVTEVRAAPDMAGTALAERCAALDALVLEREGALRCLRGVNKLLAPGERGAVLAPLRALRLSLARRNLVLGLRAALEDPEGRVRAAALDSAVRAFPAERHALLHGVLATPPEVPEFELVTARALALIARYGAPSAPEGVEPARDTAEWVDLCIRILRSALDGPNSTAACAALAKLTGEPPTVMPEVWVARWRAARAAVSAGGGGVPAGAP